MMNPVDDGFIFYRLSNIVKKVDEKEYVDYCKTNKEIGAYCRNINARVYIANST